MFFCFDYFVSDFHVLNRFHRHILLSLAKKKKFARKRENDLNTIVDAHQCKHQRCAVWAHAKQNLFRHTKKCYDSFETLSLHFNRTSVAFFHILPINLRFYRFDRVSILEFAQKMMNFAWKLANKWYSSSFVWQHRTTLSMYNFNAEVRMGIDGLKSRLLWIF